MSVRSFRFLSDVSQGDQAGACVALSDPGVGGHPAIIPGNTYKCQADLDDETVGVTIVSVYYGMVDGQILPRDYPSTAEFRGELNPVPPMPPVPGGG